MKEKFDFYRDARSRKEYGRHRCGEASRNAVYRYRSVDPGAGEETFV